MTDKKVRSKHIGYNAQREQCRLNKYTYTEKIGGSANQSAVPVLFCNYPFSDPSHKKGLCKASTCTDMREIPDDVVAADAADMTIPPLTDPVNVDRTILTGENTPNPEADDALGKEVTDNDGETIEVPGEPERNGEDSKDSTFEDNTPTNCKSKNNV